MLSWHFHSTILALCILPHASSQFISSLPQCVQNCITQSDDENCSVSDIKCLCRASAGNFLPDLITCTHGNCDDSLDNDALLMPLQLACQIAGTPIPDSAMRNAEVRASSLASRVTTTVTMAGETGGSAAVTTSGSSDYIEHSVSTATVTTTQGESTLTLVFPVTITMERTSTVSGSPSPSTRTTSPSASTFTSTPASSTDSSAGAVAVSSSYLSTETASTSVGPASTSSGGKGASKTSSAQLEDSTNSSPFKDSNSGSAPRSVDDNWLGLAVVVVAVCLWF
ncbi:hypothetical protein LCER1_G005002 [Lachnellula cervina]|uniref:CFEM domain-containing protein n=1 Tax=Lachnellula cervina TaxID=1316786 RepID=A0A7D8YMB2_9HELO|nr:hypothetical protein LCER1_G005002 [Lachnellula cervina]